MSTDILEIIAAIVKVPDETVSENEHDRFHHLDLAYEDEAELRRELAFTRWLNYVTDSEWHLKREVEIARELQRRYHQPKRREPAA